MNCSTKKAHVLKLVLVFQIKNELKKEPVWANKGGITYALQIEETIRKLQSSASWLSRILSLAQLSPIPIP